MFLGVAAVRFWSLFFPLCIKLPTNMLGTMLIMLVSFKPKELKGISTKLIIGGLVRSPLMYTTIGLLILVFCFPLFSGLAIAFGNETLTLANALGVHSEYYYDLIRETIVTGFLPVGAGLVFCAVGYIKLRNSQPIGSKVLTLVLLLFAFYCLILALLNLTNAFTGYSKAIEDSDYIARLNPDINAAEIKDKLPTLYGFYGSLSILWFLSSIFLAATGCRRQDRVIIDSEQDPGQ